jgi:hypothetical protein
MKHIQIIYAILLFVLLIYINKTFYLEGYTFMPVLNIKDASIIHPTLTKSTLVQQSTCEKNCSAPEAKCGGFTSDIPNNTNKLGNCTYYSDTLNKTTLPTLIYDAGTNLYIK